MIRTAASGRYSDIQAAIDAVYAAGGGTVIIPNGDFALGGSVVIRAGIALLGDGATIMRTSGQSQIITLGGDTARAGAFSLISTNYDGGNGIKVGNYQDWRIDHLRIEGYGTNSAGIYVSGGSCTGVIDHNYVKNKPVSSLGYGVVVYGGGTYDSTPVLGTANAVFVEDNTFINCRHSIASNNGARYVFRYNLVQQNVYGMPVDAHGGSYGSSVGSTCWEVYGNTIESPSGTFHGQAVQPRGGTGVIWGNTIRGYDYAVLFCVEDGMGAGVYPAPYQVHDAHVWGNGPLRIAATSYNNSTFYLHKDRDWFEYALPGYTPYQYPHPLAVGGLSQFLAGTIKMAQVPITVRPAGLSCISQLRLGPAVSDRVPFASSGAEQSIAHTITLPTAGPYQVDVGVTVGEVVLTANVGAVEVT
jgi:hypothetical protein